ncbi:HTH-type transcriptional regulator GbpR [Pigmentiphaga humi]|uniref:HTH-type transcriptional regulator GbpR n=1 Tax=Pigmentiphaga humi TaxID=2478468 RepID=A0A3P4B1K7_9BURK|nr:LysR substrate-binding domain-containing protein [Pigmentiphaga humi]VCU69035.1 HTH-type transcriptional regulator GbpR [Pigmentiphaga humi]
MKLHQLRIVLAVADKGSLRAAARELGISQPAITHSIAELERDLGATLFERNSRGVIPTPAGTAFLQRAAVIVSEARRAREEVAQILGSDQGSVTICLSIAAHLALLPMALPLFQRRYPQVRLRIVEGAFPAHEARLRDGSMDFYIGPAPEPAPAREFAVEALFPNTRAVFARRGHPLAQARSLKDLADAGWITTGITDKAEVELLDTFERYRLPAPRLVLQAESMLSMLLALTSSDLLAMTLRQYDEFPLSRGAIQRIPIKEALPAPPIVIVRRMALPLTPAADYLCDMFRRAAAAYVSERGLDGDMR